MLSMLGCVVGTGNIWRFPRIMALHAEEGGTLTHIIHSFMLYTCRCFGVHTCVVHVSDAMVCSYLPH